MLSSVHIVAEEKVAEVPAQNLILLVLLVLVRHLLEHVQQIAELSVNISENLHRRLELKQRLLILKYFLNLLQQVINNFLRQIHEWDVLRVLPLVSDDLVVEIVDNDVHDEPLLVLHVRLCDLRQGLLELLAPYFLDVQRLLSILLGLEVPVEKRLQLLLVGLLAQALLLNGGEVFVLARGQGLVCCLRLRCCTAASGVGTWNHICYF